MSDYPLGDVVIVDDDEALLDSFEAFLQFRNCAVRKSVDADGCLREFQTAVPDMAVIDLGLEDEDKDGIWLLHNLQANYPDVPVVVLSGYARLDIGVRAMRIGAFDFIEKPVMPAYLFEVVKRTIVVGQERRMNRRLSQALLERPVKIAGSSLAARQMEDTLSQQAEKNCRLMLLGPPGAGKKHAARFIHHMSHRNSKPFVLANCRATSEEAIEKDLFGVALDSGAYIPGKIEQVDGGTIYFDEICALPLAVQQKLVGALVRGKFKRVGGGPVSGIDCRVVSGTAEDIHGYVQNGRLSKDLFERLNVENAGVPPLDVRREDIPELCDHFEEEFHWNCSLMLRGFSDDALDYLKSMNWPGNVRQLRNLVELMLLKNDEGQPVVVEEIDQKIEDLGDAGSQVSMYWKMTLREARNAFERQYLITQINRHGGNISNAAQSIGMERSALHRKLKGLEVETKAHSGGRIAGLKEARN